MKKERPPLLETKYLQKQVDNLISIVDEFATLNNKDNLSEEETLKIMSYLLSFRGYASYIEDEINYIKNEMTALATVRQYDLAYGKYSGPSKPSSKITKLDDDDVSDAGKLISLFDKKKKPEPIN
jgi:hypothetical protein